MTVNYIAEEGPQFRAFFPEQGEPVIEMLASEIRLQTTGLHANILLGYAPTRMPLESDTFNLGRREDRLRLGNAAYKILPPEAQAIYRPEQMQLDLLSFCGGLRKAFMGAITAERTKGDATPSEPQFLVKDYVIKGAGTILFAPPGRGKSWTGMLLTVSIDSGSDVMFRVREQTPSLYVNLERSAESMARRLGMVNQVLGLPRDRELLMFHARGKTLADVNEAMLETVRKEGIGFVLLDSLSRSGVGDLNDNRAANTAMDLMNGLPCAWAVLAHTPRADESHIYGSQMFDAAADLGVMLMTEESMDAADSGAPRLGIGLKVTKANDTAKPPLRVVAYEFDARFGLTGVRKALPGEFSKIEDVAYGEMGEKRTNEEVIKTHLGRVGKSSATSIEKATGINKGTASRLLSTLLATGEVASQTIGREKFYWLPSTKVDLNVDLNVVPNPHPPERGVVPATFDSTTPEVAF